MFKWLLPGILCVLAIIFMITFDILYCVMIKRWVDQDTWYGETLAHLGIKIWIVLPTIGLMYLAARFAIRRLIYNRRPPEIEEKF